jgi:hypothetical protein
VMHWMTLLFIDMHNEMILQKRVKWTEPPRNYQSF